ncbi:SMP-30/gluconolactonase/LRE family protein [Nocardioides sp.]|uniref:SMP-30/gluconolactonase/LRE family protein n=1 Tax=Nocardioides sp. TaxID=35761 RepID=UPI003515048D
MPRRLRLRLLFVPLLAAGAAAVPVGPGPLLAPATAVGECTAWSATPIASGLGTLENLSFDRRGAMLVSSSERTGGGSVLRVAPSGEVTTLLDDVVSPGGQVVRGRTLYVTTGNAAASGILGRADGTLLAVDLRPAARGRARTVAEGLTMPNGLIRLPGGDFVVSRDLGATTSMTRLRRDGTRTPLAPSVTSTNGMVLDRTGRFLFVVSTFTPTTTVSRVDLRRPDAAPRVFTVPGLGPLNAADEITRRGDDLYLTLNAAGRVVRLDPATGETCVIAEGLAFASSLRFGAGPGWRARSLYVTGFTGTITRLDPPA